MADRAELRRGEALMGNTFDDASVSAAVPVAGWLVVLPDGQPYAWYAHGWKGCTDSTAAMELFETSPQARDALIAAGWSARPGGPTDLYLCAHQRISA